MSEHKHQLCLLPTLSLDITEELPGFHPVISVLHRPHSTKRQTRARFNQQAWKERTNHRTRYTRSLSISGKAKHDLFSHSILTFIYTPKTTRSSFCTKNIEVKKYTLILQAGAYYLFLASRCASIRYLQLKPRKVLLSLECLLDSSSGRCFHKISHLLNPGTNLAGLGVRFLLRLPNRGKLRLVLRLFIIYLVFVYSFMY